jgi:hypothetical protein
VAVVTGILLDHVDIDPAEVDVLLQLSQLSSVVRSSAFRGGIGRSMVLTGRLWRAAAS